MYDILNATVIKIKLFLKETILCIACAIKHFMQLARSPLEGVNWSRFALARLRGERALVPGWVRVGIAIDHKDIALNHVGSTWVFDWRPAQNSNFPDF